MQRKQTHRFAITGLAILIVCVAAYATFKLTIGGSVFAGESRHDFGILLIDDPISTFEHTFKLTNRTGKTLNIKDIKPSCGCTVAAPNTRTLAPGREFVLETKLTLKSSSSKEIRITITFDDDTIEDLWLEADGRMHQPLLASSGVLSIMKDKPTTLVVFAEVWDDVDNAPEPKIVTDEGFEAKFTRWNLQSKANDVRGEPARWSGKIEVIQTADTAIQKAQLTVQFKDSEPVLVRVHTDYESLGMLEQYLEKKEKDEPSTDGDGE